jgi:hypothetical protein
MRGTWGTMVTGAYRWTKRMGSRKKLCARMITSTAAIGAVQLDVCVELWTVELTANNEGTEARS